VGDTHQDVKNIQVYIKIKLLLSIKVAY